MPATLEKQSEKQLQDIQTMSDAELREHIEDLEYALSLYKQVEDFRAGRLKTYTLDEVKAHCGLSD